MTYKILSLVALLSLVIGMLYATDKRAYQRGVAVTENKILITEAKLNEKQKKVRANPPSLDVVIDRLHAGTF